jgi:hypothetical protein
MALAARLVAEGIMLALSRGRLPSFFGAQQFSGET